MANCLWRLPVTSSVSPAVADIKVLLHVMLAPSITSRMLARPPHPRPSPCPALPCPATLHHHRAAPGQRPPPRAHPPPKGRAQQAHSPARVKRARRLHATCAAPVIVPCVLHNLLPPRLYPHARRAAAMICPGAAGGTMPPVPMHVRLFSQHAQRRKRKVAIAAEYFDPSVQQAQAPEPPEPAVKPLRGASLAPPSAAASLQAL